MLWFKSCPKCERGDVVLQKDFYGPHFLCLQCGYVRDVDDGARRHQLLGTGGVEVAMAGAALGREMSTALVK